MRNWRVYCGKSAVMAAFLLCALPVVLTTALVTPPGQSPDEPRHYARALGLLRGELISVRHMGIDKKTGKPEEQTGVKVESGLIDDTNDMFTRMNGRPVVTRGDLRRIETWPQDKTLEFVNLPNTATYFPAAYVPAALGVAAARIFSATPYECFITARLFSATAFLLTALAALYVCAFGEAVLFTVLILPMTLFLGGTLNQDGMLTALTCLAGACLTRGGRRWRIAGLIAFALVLGAKPPYILLFGVFTLPLFAPGFRRRFADMLLAMIPVAAWVVLVSLFIIVPYGKARYFPGPLYTGDRSIAMTHANAAAQLHILLARPSRLLTLPYVTWLKYGYVDYLTMLGVLGPLQLVLNFGYYNVWGYVLALIAAGLLFTRRPEFTPPRTALINFIAVALAIAVTYWIIQITFYLDWTNVGLDYIEGFQGRYALILLPFVIFGIPHISALPGLRRVRFSLPPLLLALPGLALALYDIGYIPLKLVMNYYLH